MPEKSGFNFSLPKPVAELFQGLMKDRSQKQKWIVLSAAVLAYADLTEQERAKYVMQVASAEVSDGYEELVRSHSPKMKMAARPRQSRNQESE